MHTKEANLSFAFAVARNILHAIHFCRPRSLWIKMNIGRCLRRGNLLRHEMLPFRVSRNCVCALLFSVAFHLAPPVGLVELFDWYCIDAGVALSLTRAMRYIIKQFPTEFSIQCSFVPRLPSHARIEDFSKMVLKLERTRLHLQREQSKGYVVLHSSIDLR